MLKILKRFAIWISMFKDVPNMKKEEEKEKEQKPEKPKEFKFEIQQLRTVDTDLNKQVQEVTNIRKKRDKK